MINELLTNNGRSLKRLLAIVSFVALLLIPIPFMYFGLELTDSIWKLMDKMIDVLTLLIFSTLGLTVFEKIPKLFGNKE